MEAAQSIGQAHLFALPVLTIYTHIHPNSRHFPVTPLILLSPCWKWQMSRVMRKPVLWGLRPGKRQTGLLCCRRHLSQIYNLYIGAANNTDTEPFFTFRVWHYQVVSWLGSCRMQEGYELPRDKANKLTCAPSEDSDHPPMCAEWVARLSSCGH